ncbi:class I SAM-dependent methyltransferase [Jiangella alkaliphila]|uniref:class I SAM-dependent methyltransferase n=1 Tax=Jiangella alkaliphila TaxID=419479 RepID=UPI00155FB90E|nr:methyltransferase domain-containing protein [Jiangella alkaliphila]
MVGIDAGANEIFYAMRLGRLLDLVGDVSESRAPLRVLDAGCGKGWFARAMARFGHRVDGIDISQAAIEECRAQAADQDEYAVSALADWHPPYMYDVVYSVDVLFHVMDDDAWADSVRNLASLVRLGAGSSCPTTGPRPTTPGPPTSGPGGCPGTVRWCSRWATVPTSSAPTASATRRSDSSSSTG